MRARMPHGRETSVCNPGGLRHGRQPWRWGRTGDRLNSRSGRSHQLKPSCWTRCISESAGRMRVLLKSAIAQPSSDIAEYFPSQAGRVLRSAGAFPPIPVLQVCNKVPAVCRRGASKAKIWKVAWPISHPTKRKFLVWRRQHFHRPFLPGWAGTLPSDTRSIPLAVAVHDTDRAAMLRVVSLDELLLFFPSARTHEGFPTTAGKGRPMVDVGRVPRPPVAAVAASCPLAMAARKWGHSGPSAAPQGSAVWQAALNQTFTPRNRQYPCRPLQLL